MRTDDTRSNVSSLFGIAGSAAAALFSLCCTIPALSAAIVAVFGVGGAVTLASLAPYRLWIMPASAVLLLFAAYTSFRRPCATVPRAISVFGLAMWVFALWAWIAIR